MLFPDGSTLSEMAAPILSAPLQRAYRARSTRNELMRRVARLLSPATCSVLLTTDDR
jgi:hypothetical protein